MNNLPLEVELIIYKYLHEINMSHIKNEINKNLKISFIYKLKWKGIKNNNLYDISDIHTIYDQEYDKIMTDKNITCTYFRNNLENYLMKLY